MTSFMPGTSMRRLRPLAPALSLLLATACSDIVGVATREKVGASGPARVSLNASLELSGTSAADEVVLKVNASYIRADQQHISLGSQVLSLTTEELQQVPVPIDVASCLSDALRTPADVEGGVCRVILAMTLEVNGAQVDAQQVGPLSLKPGSTFNVQEPVTLVVIDGIDLLDANGVAITSPLQLAVGSGAAITAIIRDDQDRVVENRTAAWSSSNNAVATVNASGQITTISAGNATITASAASVSASFEVNVLPPPVALTIVARPGSGSGSVKSLPAGIDCRIVNGVASGTCTFAFSNGAEVQLTSTPDEGSTFSVWGDECVGAAVGNACQLTLNAARIASAEFAALRTFSIVGAASGDGNGHITGTGGIDCTVQGLSVSGSCTATVPDGAILNLIATASGTGQTAHTFGGWSGACATSATGECAVTVQGSNASTSASFLAPRTLHLTLSGTGDGSVIAAGGIECQLIGGESSGNCSASYLFGTNVVLTAVPSSNSSFTGWTGACEGAALTCIVPLDAARNVSATFVRRLVTITIRLTGSGQGSVTAEGTTCTRDHLQDDVVCKLTVDAGTQVQVAATAGMKTTFGGFTGACTGSNCQFAANNDASIEARFNSETIAVNISNALGGTAAGRIIGSDAAQGVDCRISGGTTTGTCTFVAPYSSNIILVAVPEANSMLRQWAGGCETAHTTTCSFVAKTNEQVAAAFVPSVNVELTLQGTGEGVVTFDVPGLPMQSPCAFAGGAPVTCRFSIPSTPLSHYGIFRAVTPSGTVFSGFTGACRDPGSAPFNPCTFNQAGFDRKVFGTFTKQ